jgi:hypothetical protein
MVLLLLLKYTIAVARLTLLVNHYYCYYSHSVHGNYIHDFTLSTEKDDWFSRHAVG